MAHRPNVFVVQITLMIRLQINNVILIILYGVLEMPLVMGAKHNSISREATARGWSNIRFLQT